MPETVYVLHEISDQEVRLVAVCTTLEHAQNRAWCDCPTVFLNGLQWGVVDGKHVSEKYLTWKSEAEYVITPMPFVE